MIQYDIFCTDSPKWEPSNIAAVKYPSSSYIPLILNFILFILLFFSPSCGQQEYATFTPYSKFTSLIGFSVGFYKAYCFKLWK